VLYGGDWAIVHKPPHWEVDGEGGTRNATGGLEEEQQQQQEARPEAALSPLQLSHFLRAWFPASPILLDRLAGFGFLGRLDVSSSGLVLCALTHEAHMFLQLRQDTHRVAREYVTLCHGQVRPGLTVLDLPVRARPGASSVVDGGGLPAVTRAVPCAWLRRGAGPTGGAGRERLYSLLVLSIVTGRKHQIRCQLAHAGHPVVCDARYAPGHLPGDRRWCARIFLHRFRLALGPCPGQGCAVPLPVDLRSALAGLRPVGERRGGGESCKEALALWTSRSQPPCFDDWAAKYGS